MPRHHFRFPSRVRESIRQYVDNRVSEIDPSRFKQEPKYVSALIKSLEGIPYEDSDGYVRFRATDVDDRGKGSAESWSGIDFVLTVTIEDPVKTVEKVICVQAKLGEIETMPPSELDELLWQIEKMKNYTRSPKVMEIVESNGIREPFILSGNRVLEDEPYESVPLSDYIVRRVLTTLDGDTRPSFVSAVQDSSLPALEVTAYTSINR